ncbi:MAG: hypothetical protein KAX44_08130 [Candidatus Brocadiae bacterium]|nr:hypothetical protein [Candidatus Brocadiia bacterium]
MEAEGNRVVVWARSQSWLTPSVAVLVVANLVPLYGVLFQGWQVFPIVLLFWVENIIVGVFFVLRLLTVRPQEPIGWIAKLFLVPFFVFHYGMFTTVHGVFVFALFGREMAGPGASVGTALALSAVGKYHLAAAVVALALSHGFSYAWNYLGKGEYRRANIGALMARPYGRVVVLHLAIIGGGFLLMALNSPVAGLVLLLVLKVGLDIAAHRREHREAPDDDQAASAPKSTP